MVKNTGTNYSTNPEERKGYSASPRGEEIAEEEELDFSRIDDSRAKLEFGHRRGPPTLFDKSFGE